MRVITGTAKGHQLKAVKGMATRPTSDKVKQALFNILGNKVKQANVLDLFAGTGALGIEALSRGANSTVFVDNSVHAVQVIKDNLLHTKLGDYTEIRQCDAFTYLRVHCASRQFDLIFCDPPYHKTLSLQVIKALAETNILAPNGILVVEHSVRDELPDTQGQLKRSRSEKYGDTVITFYIRIKEDA